MNSSVPKRTYFFDDGIRFECTRCGNCCTGAPGTVFATEEEVQRIAATGRVPHGDSIGAWAKRVPGGYHLGERENGDCVFYEAFTCSIHECRPAQCRTYPFWFKNMRTVDDWRRTCEACPGIGEGRLHGREEVLELLGRDLDARPKHPEA